MAFQLQIEYFNSIRKISKYLLRFNITLQRLLNSDVHGRQLLRCCGAQAPQEIKENNNM